MNFRVGQRVDRFLVEGVIGAGGTATVYRVRHERLGTLHALKVLSLAGDTIRDRLLVEGQAQATLNHPNVVAVTDILDVDGQPGLLMEYIEGPSLEDALAESSYTLDELEVLFHGVLDGVEAAHKLGLVHRDLKLANILLEPTPQGYVPKVTDFGLAKVLQNRPAGVGATRTGIAMGTPGFMAPEQVRDAGKVDQRADMFSLGCILYEMATGQRAFPGDEVLQIYIKVTKVDYVPARQVKPELPDRVDQAIRGCLQLDPAKRIPNCATLRAVLDGELGWEQGPVAAAPTAPAAHAPALPPVAPPAELPTDRALPLLLLGGSLMLLMLVVFFVLLTIGVPLVYKLSQSGRGSAAQRAEVPALPAAPGQGVAVPAEWLPEPEGDGVASAPEPEAPAAVDDEPDAPEAGDDAPVERPPDEPSPRPAAPPPRPARPVAPAPPPRRAVAASPLEMAPSEGLIDSPAPVPAPAPVGPPIEIKLFSKPTSAAIHVDGVPAGLRTPNKLSLAPGMHRVELHLRGFPPAGFNLVVGPGNPDRWCLDMTSGLSYSDTCPR